MAKGLFDEFEFTNEFGNTFEPDVQIIEESAKKEEKAEEPEIEDKVDKEIELKEEEPKEDEVDETEVLLENFKNLYNFLGEEFDGNLSSMAKTIEELPTKLYNSYLDNVKDDLKPLVNYLFTFGKDADKTVVKTYLEAESNFISNAEAKVYLRKILEKDYEEDDLDDYLDILEKKDKLLSIANNKKSKETDAIIQIQLQAKQEALFKEQEQSKKLVDDIERYMVDNNIHQKQKDAVYKNLSSERIKVVNDEVAKSPEAIVQLALIYDAFDPKTKKFDFSKISKKEVTKQMEDVREKLRSIPNTTKGGRGGSKNLLDDFE